jgi:hypothetical protein
MAAELLWRKVLMATIDTLRGRSRGQYDIRLARPDGIEDFFRGLPRVDTDLGGYNVQVPIAAAIAPAPVPATSLTVAYIGPESERKDWRIPSQRPETAYPLWRLGVGLRDDTEPGTDFIVIVRDAADVFHARWLRGEQLSLLPDGLAVAMRASNAGVASISDAEWDDVRAGLDLPEAGRVEPTPSRLGRGAGEAGEAGEAYREEDEAVSTPRPEPFAVDPDVVDRGISAHRRTQNLFAASLRAAGFDALSHRVGVDPSFDIGWRSEDVFYVGEVKSLTPRNEERQLRLALGQVLRYASQLRVEVGTVVPVIICEAEPTDPTWVILCDELGVGITWPDTFEPFILR